MGSRDQVSTARGSFCALGGQTPPTLSRIVVTHLQSESAKLTIASLLSVAMVQAVSAQQPGASAPSAETTIVFVNVNVVPMDSDQVVTGQAVLVRGDRIVAVAPLADVAVPQGTTIVDGAGGYLVPGLIDAHVHLQTPDGVARAEFGDAPLYLAHGITTVFNLRGTPTHLEWKRRVATGELLGPTIYTAGEFVNEPRVNTPEEVEREIAAQVRAGYDLIKFHEVMGTPDGDFATTTGLSLPAYLRMHAAAREAGIPVIGHGPMNLGLEALLSSPGALAHVGELTTLYFVPRRSMLRSLLISVGAVGVLLIIVAGWAVGAIVGRRPITRPPRSPARTRVQVLTGAALLVFVLAFACGLLVGPGARFFDSVLLRVVFSSLIVVLAVIATFLAMSTVRAWRDAAVRTAWRFQASAAAVSVGVLVLVAATYWLPIGFRTSDRGMARLAERVRDAGIWVQSTLSVYDAVAMSPADLSRLVVGEPTFKYLHPVIRERWRRAAQQRSTGGGIDALVAPRYLEFTQRLTGALHRAGVRLMAGTDTLGFPLIVPGASLHRELQLLVESGLTPYEALRTATINPATFLGKDHEFGTIAVGTRADLVLVERNPLQDLAQLRQPIGVMVRGNWLPRAHLQQLLGALADKQ